MGTNKRKRRRLIRQIFFLFIIALFLPVAFLSYQSWYHDSKLLHVRFESAQGVISPEFKLEIAATAAERSKGLMYRKSLASDRGMIFIYPEETRPSFWMRNTYVPLDMIFINKDMKVVGMLEEVPVLSDEKRDIGAPSQYVVELTAGSAKKHGIQVGSILKYEGELPRGERDTSA